MNEKDFKRHLQRFADEANNLFGYLQQAYDIELTKETLNDLLFNSGYITRQKIIEPQRNILRALGKKNEDVYLDTIEKNLEIINNVISAFSALDFQLAFLLTVKDKKIVLKTKNFK